MIFNNIPKRKENKRKIEKEKAGDRSSWSKEEERDESCNFHTLANVVKLSTFYLLDFLVYHYKL